MCPVCVRKNLAPLPIQKPVLKRVPETSEIHFQISRKFTYTSRQTQDARRSETGLLKQLGLVWRTPAYQQEVINCCFAFVITYWKCVTDVSLRENCLDMLKSSNARPILQNRWTTANLKRLTVPLLSNCTRGGSTGSLRENGFPSFPACERVDSHLTPIWVEGTQK